MSGNLEFESSEADITHGTQSVRHANPQEELNAQHMRSVAFDKKLQEVRLDLNDALPPEIRCWGMSKVPSGFFAQKSCDWREYEYILPAKLVHDNEEDSDSEDSDSAETKRAREIALFRNTLKLFEGTNSFHNFTKAKAMKKKLNPKINSESKNQSESESVQSESNESPPEETTNPSEDKSATVFNEDDFLTQFDNVKDDRNHDEEENHEEEEEEEEEEEVIGSGWSRKDSADEVRMRMSNLNESNRTITECSVLDEIITVGGMDTHTVQINWTLFEHTF